MTVRGFSLFIITFIDAFFVHFTRVVLRKSFDDRDTNAPARVVKTLKHENLLKELEDAKKTAQLRSGARGLKARKELKAIELQFEEETSRYIRLVFADTNTDRCS